MMKHANLKGNAKKNGNKNDETVFTTICYAHTTNIFDAMMQQRTRKHIQLFQTI